MIERTRTKQEKGLAAFEFALVLPMLIFFVALIFDFGIFLHNRMILQQISYEVARSASRLQPLESAVAFGKTIGEMCWNDSTNWGTCCADPTYCPPNTSDITNHTFVLRRAKLLLQLSRISFANANPPYTIKNRIDVVADTVEITITAQYNSIWNILGFNLPLRARALVPLIT